MIKFFLLIFINFYRFFKFSFYFFNLFLKYLLLLLILSISNYDLNNQNFIDYNWIDAVSLYVKPYNNSLKELLCCYDLYNLKPFDENFFEINNINVKYPKNCRDYLSIKYISNIIPNWQIQNNIALNYDFETFLEKELEPLVTLESVEGISKMDYFVEKKKTLKKNINNRNNILNLITFVPYQYLNLNLNFYLTKILFRSVDYKHITFFNYFFFYLDCIDQYLKFNNNFFCKYRYFSFNENFFYYKFNVKYNLYFFNIDTFLEIRKLEFPVLKLKKLIKNEYFTSFENYIKSVLLNLYNIDNFYYKTFYNKLKFNFNHVIKPTTPYNLLKINNFYIYDFDILYQKNNLNPFNINLYNLVCFDLNIKTNKNLSRLEYIRCIYTVNSLESLARPAKFLTDEIWDISACVYDCCVYNRVGFFSKCTFTQQTCDYVHELNWIPKSEEIYDYTLKEKKLGLTKRIYYNLKYLKPRKRKKPKINFTNYEPKYETECPYGFFYNWVTYYELDLDSSHEDLNLKFFTF